jgi:lipopolysaccharide cholinephosphotransferase
MNETVTIKETQQTELEVLRVVMEILDRHGLKAYLAGGTCLGYVRHGGFIPWDDDIDIMMMRSDYEKAKDVLINELPSEYKYCDYLEEEEYPYNFAKVRKIHTAFVHAGDAHLNINHGIYIDIFPLDCAFKDSSKQKKACSKILSLRLKVDLAYMSFYKYGHLRKVWMLPIIFFSHFIYNGTKIQKRIENLIKKWDNINSSDYEKIVSYNGSYKNEIHNKTILGNGKRVDFCGVPAWIPEKYEDYLRNLFGDFMKLPPLDKRVSHHDVIYLSLNSDYKPASTK